MSLKFRQSSSNEGPVTFIHFFLIPLSNLEKNSDDALLCKVRLTLTLAFVSFKLSFKLLTIDLGDPTWVSNVIGSNSKSSIPCESIKQKDRWQGGHFTGSNETFIRDW